MMGAKKILKKKKKPQRQAVKPVRAPASTPAPLSMYEVTGDNPKKLPKIVANASLANAMRDFGKSPVSSTYPSELARANSVPCPRTIENHVSSEQCALQATSSTEPGSFHGTYRRIKKINIED